MAQNSSRVIKMIDKFDYFLKEKSKKWMTKKIFAIYIIDKGLTTLIHKEDPLPKKDRKPDRKKWAKKWNSSPERNANSS